MITLDKHTKFIADLLQNLQVHLENAQFTHCYPEWQELNYIPNYNKFYLICDGEGWLKIGGQEFKPVAGQLCLMPAHVEQSYSTINDHRYSKYWCHFTATMGDLDLFQWLEVPYCLNLTHSFESLKNLFEELASLHEDPSFISRIKEKSILLEIIALFLQEADQSENSHIQFTAGRAQDIERLHAIEQFINDHMSEPVSLEQIAKQVHLHPNYLVRYFNKYFAVSPLKYLNRKRMQKARALLTTTSLTVREVAEAVGFPDTNHFAKAFRKENSCSPTEYRSQATLDLKKTVHN
ncbi:AraC family transcriptional regulator [Paenibacillus sp. CMAA1364]